MESSKMVKERYQEIISSRINANTKLSSERKQKELERISKWMVESDIFKPLSEMEDEEWEIEGVEVDSTGAEIVEIAIPELINVSEESPKGKEERILKWQKHYESMPPVFDDLDDESGLNERGEFGRTALHVAALSGDVAELKRLLDAGADATVRDNNGYTPYLLALLEDKDEVIKILEERKIRE
jgi:hypothetical protein